MQFKYYNFKRFLDVIFYIYQWYDKITLQLPLLNVFFTCSSHAMIRRTHQTFRFSQNPFWLPSLRHIGYQLRGNIRDSYSLLNVTNDSSDDEVREAYLRLAKIYHPDSGTSSADPRKFNQVREAYMTIKVYMDKYLYNHVYHTCEF